MLGLRKMPGRSGWLPMRRRGISAEVQTRKRWRQGRDAEGGEPPYAETVGHRRHDHDRGDWRTSPPSSGEFVHTCKGALSSALGLEQPDDWGMGPPGMGGPGGPGMTAWARRGWHAGRGRAQKKYGWRRRAQTGARAAVGRGPGGGGPPPVAAEPPRWTPEVLAVLAAAPWLQGGLAPWHRQRAPGPAYNKKQHRRELSLDNSVWDARTFSVYRRRRE